MKRRDMGELFAKVLGVFFLYWCFRGLASGYYFSFFMRQSGQSVYFPQLTVIGTLAALLLAGLFCLIKSKAAGQILFPDNPEGPLIEQINVLEVQVMLFSAIGLIFLISGALSLLQDSGMFIVMMIHMKANPGQPGSETQHYYYISRLVSFFLQIALGYFLFQKSRRLATKLLGGQVKASEHVPDQA